MRIGHGFDAHRFEEGRKLVLGGVEIAFPAGMAAHSDGDVVLHALCDALLGAAALGDLGEHFPDTDSRWKGCNSRIFLREINKLLHKKEYRIGNIDLTIVAETPKLASYRAAMRANIAADLEIELDQVNIKATTTEQMGFTGRKEGIAAFAVVLIWYRGSESNRHGVTTTGF